MSDNYVAFENKNADPLKGEDVKDPRSHIELKRKVSDGHDSARIDASNSFTNVDFTTDSSTKRGSWKKQLVSFRIMAMPYFREVASSRCMFGLLVLLSLLNSAVRVLFSYLMSDFWSALSDKNVEDFYRILIRFVIALLFLAPINVMYQYLKQRLAIEWREWMTNRMLHLYYSNRAYYKIEQQNQNIDNPDQRISEDVKSFTAFSLSFFLIILNSTLDCIAFSIVLFSIKPQLFVTIIFFAVMGTLGSWLIGKKLIGLNFEKLKKEADFRFSLVRIRENAESIAFYALRGVGIESIEIDRRFRTVIKNMHEINSVQRNLNFFTAWYGYLVWLLPIVVVAPEYFAGNIAIGVVQQSSVAFNHILEDMSFVVDQFESLSEFFAGIDRLYQLFDAVKRVHSTNEDVDGSSFVVNVHPVNSIGDAVIPQSTNLINLSKMMPLSFARMNEQSTSSNYALILKELVVYTPDYKRAVINNLHLSLRWGENLLIVGSSGVGKSSLLRAIAGLWSEGHGTIHRPNDNDVHFLPQRPYCMLGSLRNQLLYPNCCTKNNIDEGHITQQHAQDGGSRNQRVGDDELLMILDKIELAEVSKRAGDGDALRGLDAIADWGNTLSLGEQQRLAFGRILINKPSLVICDESTSALDIASETKMYNLLRDMTADQQSSASFRISPPTVISVGHRPSLRSYHNVELNLKNGNNYTFGPIEESDI